ncbi:hypothetical protein L8V01_05935 [Corynebacterium sp. c8Ua_181]|uniref:Uncharacterized protein n=1 Tax=Corynebacterium curieae TaxID=2913500 RepID=A0A9X3MA74_9CORY|nr:hypothetical protein [Corynebacterium curieae]MCZ9307019.1 hypothetical protein [Corynebacterium curieae]MDV2423176.1 hypothetical protein [Corynebacterium curieae]
MKNIQRSLVAAVIAASLAVTACSPAEDGAAGEDKGGVGKRAHAAGQ